MEQILYQALQINGNDITEKTVKNKLPDALDYEQCMRMILDIGAQIELLKRYQNSTDQTDDLDTIIFSSINHLAAAMQTSG